MINIVVRAVINPTESEDKVSRAVENLFPNMEFNREENELVARGNDINDLAALKELLKNQNIRDAARSFLSKYEEGNTLLFELNKQAAFAGRANFVDFDIALGAITVEIKGSNLQGLIDWLCN